MNLTGKQWMAIVGAVLSVVVTASAQLTDIFGATVAKDVISVAGLANLILQSVTVAISSQAQVVKDAAALPGVSAITLNTQASQSVAAVAADPGQGKVSGTTPAVQQTLETIAKGS